ncbi:hypothetical protein JCM3775_001953 [Rhodotorula graminis]
MHADANEGTDPVQLADLFTSEDIVDRVVSSVTDNDVYMTIMYVRDLDKKGARDMINSGLASMILFLFRPS